MTYSETGKKLLLFPAAFVAKRKDSFIFENELEGSVSRDNLFLNPPVNAY